MRRGRVWSWSGGGEVVEAVDAAGSVEVHESPPVVAERSPADVVRVGVAAASLVVVVVLQWIGGHFLTDNTHDLLRGLDTLPSWFVTLIVAVTWLAGLIAFVGGAVVAGGAQALAGASGRPLSEGCSAWSSPRWWGWATLPARRL
jgi:hypothetical protein